MPKCLQAMNRLLIALLLMFLPVAGFAQEQEVENLDVYVWQLNAQCPYQVENMWAITSIMSIGDTVSVSIQAPALLKGFLSQLTEDTDNVKRMWTDQLMHYGDSWKHLVGLIVGEHRWLQIILTPEESTRSAAVVVGPEALGTVFVGQ